MKLDNIDAQLFRETLGNWPTGVAVITTFVDGVPLGMAMNSLTSVSLEPPLIGFFPGKSSSTWPNMQKSTTFCVNLLALHQEPVSRLFAARGADRFAEVAWHERSTGPGLDDAAAWIECELEAEIDTGDHTLVLGRVVGLESRADAEPLVFHRGQYRALN